MGGPLAPSLANAFLDHLENTVLRKKIDACIELLNIEPTLLLRYVDDIFALFRNESDADTFLNVLNDLHPCLTFTIEKGNKSMPFLDVNVSIDSKSFVTTVYRKETHTGVFLNFYAMAPSAWKRGVIMCLLYRAKMICSSVSLFNTEVGALRDMFFRNSYSSKFFDSVLSTFRRVSDVITPSVTEEVKNLKKKKLLLLLYFAFLILVNVLLILLARFLLLSLRTIMSK